MVFRMGLLIAAVAVLWLTLASAETLGEKVERLNPEPGWAEFESDFWFIVKPLKWTAYIAFVGLLAVLGILQPICNLLWNLVTGIFQVANGICRNLLWPPFHWLLVLCIRIADAIKRVLEFIVRIFFEPLWRYVLRPTLNFCKKRYDFCLVVAGLLMIFGALLDDPEATLLSGSTAMKPLSRFEGLGHCVDDRPTLSMSVAAFEIFAYVPGCFVAHPDAAFTLLVAVAGALTLALGLATGCDNMGIPAAPQLFLLPLRAFMLLLALLLAPFGFVLVLQAWARLVHKDIGVDSMYAQLFGLDPAEGSVAQMETAGTLEVIFGFGLIGIALRLIKLALSEKFSAPSNFWKYVPLVRAGAASRLGVSLVKVGVSGLNPLHIGCFTALGVGVLMCARTISIIGGYIGNKQMSLCLNYTWRYVLAIQFEAYSVLFCFSAAAASPDPISTIVFALCAAGTFSISCLTIAYPPQLWSLGDILLSYIDCGSVGLASKVWDLLCNWVFVPFFEIVLAPLWWIIIGWVVLIFGRCAWLAGFIWAHTIGYVLERVGHVFKAVYSNPFTALPVSCGLLWVMFQIYTGVIPVPFFLHPQLYWGLLLSLKDVIYMALTWLMAEVSSSIYFVLAQMAALAVHCGVNLQWVPEFQSILGGEVFGELQFGFRFYLALLLVSLVWRYVCQRDEKKFYALFGDLKVPETVEISASIADLKRLNSISEAELDEEGNTGDNKKRDNKKKKRH